MYVAEMNKLIATCMFSTSSPQLLLSYKTKKVLLLGLVVTNREVIKMANKERTQVSVTNWLSHCSSNIVVFFINKKSQVSSTVPESSFMSLSSFVAMTPGLWNWVWSTPINTQYRQGNLCLILRDTVYQNALKW